ncbi:unnamed protein product, partial [Rotaria socialis]
SYEMNYNMVTLLCSVIRIIFLHLDFRIEDEMIAKVWYYRVRTRDAPIPIRVYSILGIRRSWLELELVGVGWNWNYSGIGLELLVIGLKRV